MSLWAAPNRTRQRLNPLTGLIASIVVLAGANSLIGLLTSGGSGQELVQTARGATVTMYGEGLYAADTWLIGAGNRGQDLAILIFELPALLLVLRWYRQDSAIAAALLAGMLAFFSYYYVSMVSEPPKTGSFRSMLRPLALLGSRSLLSHRGSTSTTSLQPCQRRPNARPWRRISSRWRQRSRWSGCQE